MSKKNKGNVFTFRLNKERDQDIIEYIHQSSTSNSVTVRNLLRNAFDRSMDFRLYNRLLQRLDELEETIKNLEQQPYKNKAAPTKSEEHEADNNTTSASSPESNEDNETTFKKSIDSITKQFGGFE